MAETGGAPSAPGTVDDRTPVVDVSGAGTLAPPGDVPAAAPEAAPPVAPPAPTSDAATTAAPAGTAAPEAAEVPAVPTPEEAVAPVVHAVADRARGQRTHPPAEAPVANASASARQPAVEQQRSAAERTVDAIDSVPAGEVPRQSFKEALRQAIDEATPKPKTEDEADRVMAQGATDASARINAQLGVQREEAAGPLRSTAQTEAAPDPAAGTPAPALVPEAPGPAPDPVGPDAVVPAPLPAERLDYSSDRSATDQAMAGAGVSTEQLQRGNEPEFAPALEARSTAETHEAAAGAQYREDEAAVRGESRAQAQERIGGGLAGMRAQRLDLVGQVVGEQQSTSTNQSQQRRLVTERVTAIKEATRNDVDVILAAMDAAAVAIFDVGLREAEAAYEDAFEEAKGGVGNWLTEWGDDWERLIEDALATGRAAYLARVGRAIDEVATLVETRLAAAKQRVAAGRAELDSYVAGLDESLRSAGEEARQLVSADFDALESSIDDRRDSLVQRLTQQYRDSYQRMSETENRLREENKSLWQRVYDATVGLIKKILEFKDMLLSALAEAASVITLIIEDPIGFLSNLIEAVMQGVTNFKDHIVEHLEKGLLDWIFGAVAGAGIQMPAKFDLQGILGLVLQILGLTWQNIRRIAVEMVGEPIVRGLEMFAEPVIVLVREGPAGLWEWIKEKLTDLKSMLLEEIQSWLITNVVEAGIKWIIGLLTPAGAFIKACMAIYDIVMFFVDKAQQIADLVKAVTSSIGAIAKGSLGAAAQRVEDALARAIPVAIGFLADLLGLGDLSETISTFIKKIRKPVEEAIRWLIGKAVDLVKAAGKLLGIGKEEGSKEGPEHDAQVSAALVALQEAVAQRTGGEAARSDAEAIAVQVQSAHPILKQVEVVDAEDSWHFHVVASDVKNKAELPKSGEGGALLKLDPTWVERRPEAITIPKDVSGTEDEWHSYEGQAARVVETMMQERIGDRPVVPGYTLPGSRGRGRSTFDKTRIDKRRAMRSGRKTVGVRIPDYTSVVPVGDRTDEIHMFDPTLGSKSYGEMKPIEDDRRPTEEIKAQQLFYTVDNAMNGVVKNAAKQGRVVTLVHYTIITDQDPSKDSKKMVNDLLSMYSRTTPRLEITWAIVAKK
ncbi:phage-related protein [Nocardioides sp. BE266]|uniref:hypothetical protein n=1 Tax=Nocardioides sp. BE266 TaxID=2817725 RepID=UPI002856D96E|nr:hypothetical protein [Nocardioides sp. BE266]MDR7254315.1 phage-related protein [Nocardioides sp. BE266]